MPQDLAGRGPEDAGRLLVGARDRVDEVLEHEHRGRQEPTAEHEDHAELAVDDPELEQHEEDRHHRGRAGDDRAQQQQGVEQLVAARDAHPAERVGRQGGEGDDQHRGADRQVERVADRRPGLRV